MSVCVFCSAAPDLPPRYLRLAGDVGAHIAGRGWNLVSGGERVSMMGAIAAAARNSGAHTLGVVPRALIHRADRESDELVVTETMGERKARMVAGAHALLALPGGLGTCEELFEAWTGRLLGAHTKPIVVLDADGHFTGLLSWLERARERGFVSRSSMDAVVRASSIAEALDACTAATVPSPREPL